jgi:hypothetical protein
MRQIRQWGKRLLSLGLAATLALGAVACSQKPAGKGDRPTSSLGSPRLSTISEVPPPPVLQELRPFLENYQPQVKILSPRPDEVLQDDKVSVRVQVNDLPLFKDKTLGLGPHVHVILDNASYKALYDASQPVVFENLEPGTHTVRAIASRPWHELFKNDGAFAQVTFHVYAKTPENRPIRNQPLLTYSRPVGSYGAEPVMLDFFLTNVPLHLIAQSSEEDDIPDWRIRATVNGESFLIDQWQPLYLKGLKPGKNWVQLELLSEDGEPIPNAFNNTVRVLNYTPGGTDALSKLVRGDLTLDEARAIVDPNYKPAPKPLPTPVVKESPTPTPSPSPAVPPVQQSPAPAPAEITPAPVPAPKAIPARPSVSPVPTPKSETSKAAEPKPEKPEKLEPIAPQKSDSAESNGLEPGKSVMPKAIAPEPPPDSRVSPTPAPAEPSPAPVRPAQSPKARQFREAAPTSPLQNPTPTPVVIPEATPSPPPKPPAPEPQPMQTEPAVRKTAPIVPAREPNAELEPPAAQPDPAPSVLRELEEQVQEQVQERVQEVPPPSPAPQVSRPARPKPKSYLDSLRDRLKEFQSSASTKAEALQDSLQSGAKDLQRSIQSGAKDLQESVKSQPATSKPTAAPPSPLPSASPAIPPAPAPATPLEPLEAAPGRSPWCRFGCARCGRAPPV